jgi:hypothetical protein
MTPIDRLERQLPAAFADLADERAPDYLVDLLGRTARTRQRPAWAFPGRWFPMQALASRPALAGIAAAVIVVVIGGGLYLSRSDGSSIGGPSASPTPSPTTSPTPSMSPSTDPTPIAQALRSTWVGAPRDIAAIPERFRYRFRLDAGFLDFPTDDFSVRSILSFAEMTGSETIRFTSTTDKDGCAAGDVGDYSWSLSPAGTRLTLTLVDDGCATREAALPGDWFKVDCKNTDDGCMGLLEAGTVPSQYVGPRVGVGQPWQPNFGALSFTVPDGWANAEDWPAVYRLTPAGDYAAETASGAADGVYHGIWVQARPAATDVDATCSAKQRNDVPQTVEGLVGWITDQPALVAGPATPVSIGGHDGQYVDVTLAPDWTGHCDPEGLPSVNLLTESGNPTGWQWGIAQGERQRLVFLDLGQGDVILVALDSTYPDRWDGLVTASMPIIESMTFE